MRLNNIIDTDSYKASHWLQYPPNTTAQFSYIESRGGKFSSVVFFGLQYILKEYMMKRIDINDIDEATEFFKVHGEPFNRKGWMRILDVHDGFIPVRIRAFPEGSIVPTHIPLVTVESTDPELPWVTSWIETQLMRVWSPINTATISYNIKKLILSYLEKSADNPMSEIAFKLHDFGSRGVSSRESAAINGAAHLVNFMGSDTCAGVWLANKYYNCDMSAFSIPAAEHSTITAWGKENEVEAYRNILAQFAKPGAIFACVSDSYDLFNAIDKMWGAELRQHVIDSGATVVIRPDSGDPANIVTQTLYALESKFGYKQNSKGYKVLNNVRVIQGDGINMESIEAILHKAVYSNGFSATNIAFGMGGALLQQHNRDTQKFAMKCSAVEINGEWCDVFKDPITDPGKASKKGRLDVIRDHNGYYYLPLNDKLECRGDTQLHIVYENGKLYNETTLEQVRNIAWPK